MLPPQKSEIKQAIELYASYQCLQKTCQGGAKKKTGRPSDTSWLDYSPAYYNHSI
jgi:hypothetical protein